MDRFESKTKKMLNGCWVWQACVSQRYPRFWLNGKWELAHRASYMIYVGEIPDGRIVRHKYCGNPLCVNPSHLALGTKTDNYDDMVVHGTAIRGEKSPGSKLTEFQVKQIRQMYTPRIVTMQFLADLFDVSSVHVFNIIHKLKWAHVE